MAIRTKSKLVEEILGENWDGCTNLTPFIAAANGMVNWIANVCDDSRLNDSAQLELIERWLAGYFYCVQDPTYTAKSQGGASGSFQRSTDKGFGSNDYGTTAMLMDLSGCLAQRSKEMQDGSLHKAGVMWGGKTKSQARTVDQRDQEDDAWRP